MHTNQTNRYIFMLKRKHKYMSTAGDHLIFRSISLPKGILVQLLLFLSDIVLACSLPPAASSSCPISSRHWVTHPHCKYERTRMAASHESSMQSPTAITLRTNQPVIPSSKTSFVLNSMRCSTRLRPCGCSTSCFTPVPHHVSHQLFSSYRSNTI